MTPKDMAQQLYDKHYFVTLHDVQAKNCALITVHEMLFEARVIADLAYEIADKNPFDTRILFWLNVKKEIPKL